MMTLTIGKLTKFSEINNFASEDQTYTDFLINESLSYQENLYSSVYLAITPGGEIAGYIALSFGSFKIKESTIGFALPTLHIGKLATDKRNKGMGVGRELIFFAFNKAIELSEVAGLFAVHLRTDSNNTQTLVPYYEKFGFTRQGNSRDLYIRVQDLKSR